jgi:hypothetical protein
MSNVTRLLTTLAVNGQLMRFSRRARAVFHTRSG